MSQRKRQTEGTTPTPIPMPVSSVPRYITADQAAALGLDPSTADAQLADAGSVLTQIDQGVPMTTRDALVAWASTTWDGDYVTRLNGALGLLAQLGLVYQLN